MTTERVFNPNKNPPFPVVTAGEFIVTDSDYKILSYH